MPTKTATSSPDSVNWFKSGDRLARAFAVAIILKGLDGILEVVGGVLLLVVSPTTIDQVSRALTQHELSEDPHDYLATHVLHAAGSLTGSSLQFGAAYLLLHGVVKIVLVAALLRDKIWAYPWMIVFLIVFIVYQIYRMTFSFSVGLLGLTIFDLVVVGLTYREYGRPRARGTTPAHKPS